MPALGKGTPQVMTVPGPVHPEQLGITDVHTHLWIDIVKGSAAGSPVLNRYAPICAELEDYRGAGGTSVLDCQPGGCGRNGPRLADLSRDSRVRIVACTGFHRQRYYPPDYWVWKATAEQAAQHFIDEAIHCLEEARERAEPVRAGFIKIACESTVRETPQEPLRGAATAAARMGARSGGSCGERCGRREHRRLPHGPGCPAGADCSLPCRQAPRSCTSPRACACRRRAGVRHLLPSKYEPDVKLWPLIEETASAELTDSLALATDMAEAEMWKNLGGGPGLCALITDVIPRLRALGLDESDIRGLTGDNIARCLAGTHTTCSRT